MCDNKHRYPSTALYLHLLRYADDMQVIADARKRDQNLLMALVECWGELQVMCDCFGCVY